MDSKLLKILKTININEKYFDEFSNAKYKDVLIDDLENRVSILI